MSSLVKRVRVSDGQGLIAAVTAWDADGGYLGSLVVPTGEAAALAIRLLSDEPREGPAVMVEMHADGTREFTRIDEPAKEGA